MLHYLVKVSILQIKNFKQQVCECIVEELSLTKGLNCLVSSATEKE